MVVVSSENLVHIPSTSRPDPTGSNLREAIGALIQDAPGIHKSALCRHLGCGWGTVGHHIRQLERSGKVTRMAWDGRTALFPTGLDAVQREQYAAYRMELGASIVDALTPDNAAPLSAVAARIGRSVRTTRRHLKVLRAVGLVEQLGAHRPRYRLSPHGLRLRGESS